MIEATRQEYSGPIPPASELAKFEQVLPGLADRIVRMAESNAGHRQHLEKTVVEGNVAAQKRGQWFAFILSLAILCTGAGLLIAGKTSLGLWIMLGDVAAMAAIFLGAKLIQKKERKERREELEAPKPSS